MNSTIIPSTINPSLKCDGCGALLYFVPGTRSLKCDHCGESNAIAIDQTATSIKSFNYENFISRINLNKRSDDMKVVECSNCGSKTILDSFTTSDKCSFCASPLVLSSKAGQQYLPPHYILPFEINREQGIEYFQKWLKKLWWAPNDLVEKVNSSSSDLQGVYLPYWTYDTDALTGYTGRRGDYYYTTEKYTVKVNDKTETRTKRVRRTRWTSVSGTVQCVFRDLTIPASKSLSYATLNELAPWKFNLLVKFDERYMSGFRSEIYQLEPQQGWLKAIELTKKRISAAVEKDIGGDEQDVSSTRTNYLNRAIKYVMLPVWISAYSYKNKVYQFTVNASTGEVIGKRPVSAIKIILFIVIISGIIAAGTLFSREEISDFFRSIVFTIRLLF